MFPLSPAAIAVAQVVDETICDANDLFLNLAQLPRDALIGKPWQQVFGAWAVAGCGGLPAALAAAGQVADLETTFVTGSGETRVALVTLVPLWTDGRKRVLVIAHDMTDRDAAQRALVAARDELALCVAERNEELAKTVAVLQAEVEERHQAERQLEETNARLHVLAAHLQNLREEERKQVAREIHDELGQELAALKMDLTLLQRKVARDPAPSCAETAGELTATAGLVDRAIQTLRGICLELRPDVLDKLGLAEAMRWQADEYRLRTGIGCDLSFSPAGISLPDAQATALFRIFQEALTNVAKHANASQIVARLVADDSAVILTVKDDGRGITPAEIAGARSLGLLSMRERVIALGGSFHVGGAPGRGTTLTAAIPPVTPARGEA